MRIEQLTQLSAKYFYLALQHFTANCSAIELSRIVFHNPRHFVIEENETFQFNIPRSSAESLTSEELRSPTRNIILKINLLSF